VSRVITVAPSSPVEIGRRTPVVPAALRRAVVVRDGGCRFPGCDRPPGWCDAHHVLHWADGGETSLDNLVLLCRPHHRLVHERFSLAIEEGGPAFRRPDGTLLPDQRSP
jgi:HNH endonuclease